MSDIPDIRTVLGALPLVWVVATLGAFHIGVRIHRLAGGRPIVSPVLIAMALLIAALHGLGVEYRAYLDQGGDILMAMLGPASIALAVPLYKSARLVRRSAVPLVCAVVTGGIAASTSAVALAWLFGAPELIVTSIALKSVTAPVAIGVADEIGTIGSLAAAFSILTGAVGTVLATWMLGHAGPQSTEALGIATGVTAHGPGTAYIQGLDPLLASYSCFATGLNAVLTALWLPALIDLVATGIR